MIDYIKIGYAVDYYTDIGYKYVEVPWWVNKEINDVTRPNNAEDFTIIENNKKLIASGEQGFIDLMEQGKLPYGSYVTVTPCFRDEEVTDLSKKYFMKVELIEVLKPSLDGEYHLASVMNEVIQYFNLSVPDNDLLSFKKTDEGYDLEYNGIEIGSYGIRTYKDHRWVYATGLAEPRFSTVINF